MTMYKSLINKADKFFVYIIVNMRHSGIMGEIGQNYRCSHPLAGYPLCPFFLACGLSVPWILPNTQDV